MRSRHVVYQEGWRYWFTCIFLLVIFTALFARFVHLMVLDRQFLQKQGQARSLRTITLPATRGTITDRLGHPLAISSPVDTLWLNPQEFEADQQQFLALAKILKQSPEQLASHLKANENKEFMYLKRHVSPEFSAQVQQLHLPGIYLQKEYRRFYPDGEIVSHVVGFTDIDEIGQEGIELSYEEKLKGTPGKQRVIKDRLGHTVDVIGAVVDAQPGEDLTLSIDHRIQFLAYQELKNAVEKAHAESGSMVVIDVESGEILAMVNQPSYNPNLRQKGAVDHYRNRAVTDLFEPGSTIKGLSVANVLQNSNMTPETTVDTSPGWIALKGGIVDDHKDNGEMTLTRVLQRSSNVGMTKFTLMLPANSLWELLHDLGFGEKTAVQFPGEVAGHLEHHRLWSPFTLGTLSFGYGMSGTTLQLAQAYGVIAAEGVKRPVSLIKQAGKPVGKRVLKAKAARDVISMLEAVVAKGGTGTQAQIPGYRVAGKTGTVRKVGANGYDKNHHLGIFVGMVPASHPRLVAAVVINDPTEGSYYGGAVAAPVFSKVMSGALRLLAIKPDGVLS